MKLAQMGLVTAMMKEVSRQAKEVGEPDTIEIWQLNALIAGANLAMEGFNREKRIVKDGEGLFKWLASDDTGMSSKFMASVLSDFKGATYAYPHDPDDFGRCYRFLNAVPGTREKMSLLKAHGEVWSKLVDEWPRLETLFIEKADCLYDEMKKLGC